MWNMSIDFDCIIMGTNNDIHVKPYILDGNKYGSFSMVGYFVKCKGCGLTCEIFRLFII